MSPRLQNFCQVFSELDSSSWDKLGLCYSENIHFKDPVHEINGLPELRSYLISLCRELKYCRFSFEQCVEDGDSAFLRWAMHYAHPKIAGGKPLTLEGVTEVTFDGELVVFHCDYYDMGAMLYEHLPVVGSIVRWLRKRLG